MKNEPDFTKKCAAFRNCFHWEMDQYAAEIEETPSIEESINITMKFVEETWKDLTERKENVFKEFIGKF